MDKTRALCNAGMMMLGSTATIGAAVETEASLDEWSWTSLEVCETLGITYRMLDYWLRCGVLGQERSWTPGSGNRRLFTVDDIWFLRICARLAEIRGTSVELLVELRQHWLEVRETRPRLLLVVGFSPVFLDRVDDLIEIISERAAAGVVVPVDYSIPVPSVGTVPG